MNYLTTTDPDYSEHDINLRSFTWSGLVRKPECRSSTIFLLNYHVEVNFFGMNLKSRRIVKVKLDNC